MSGMSVQILALGYVGVTAANPDDWEWFGPDVLGLPANREPDSPALYLRMDDRHHRLAVWPGERDGLRYLGWQVAGERELGEAAEVLDRAGVAFRPGAAEECRARRILALLQFADPAGNQVEIFYGQRSTADLGPFQPARPMEGFVTGALGAGHVVLNVRNLAACAAFYTDVLGFRVTDVSPGRMIFLRCNARHHSVAFMDVPAPPGLRHLMLETRGVDDVGTAIDLCHQREVSITKTLGRHCNDRMLSFYMRTPSGFEIEYGCGGLVVDEATWTVTHYGRPSVWGHAGLGQWTETPEQAAAPATR
jgi:extradiol dioxygenase